MKKLLIILGNTILLLVIFELVFFLIIGKSGYPTKLKNLLAYTQKSNKPPIAKPSVDWPDKSVYIRHVDTNEVINTPKVEGERFPNSSIIPQYIALNPKDVDRNISKKIFIVGGSAAFGYTCHITKSFGYLLNENLKPNYNVFNAAQVGWNSGQLVPVVLRITKYYHPELVIIMCGNNDFIQWSLSPPTPKFKLSRKVLKVCTNSHTLSFIMYKTIMRQTKLNDYSPPSDFIPHSEMYGFKEALKHPADRYISKFDSISWINSREYFLKTFENNLLAMIYANRKSGTKVLLLTMPFNYRLSPVWKSPQPWFYTPANERQIKTFIANAVEEIEKNQYEWAISILNEALSLEPNVSILNYLLAYCLEQKGQFIEAEKAYEKSRDMMVGNLGSIPSLNDVTRKVAKESRVPLIDLKNVFDNYGHDHDSYFNEMLINDDCHPNDLGQQIIADTIMNLLRSKESKLNFLEAPLSY